MIKKYYCFTNTVYIFPCQLVMTQAPRA